MARDLKCPKCQAMVKFVPVSPPSLQGGVEPVPLKTQFDLFLDTQEPGPATNSPSSIVQPFNSPTGGYMVQGVWENPLISRFLSAPWLVLIFLFGFLPWFHISCVANPYQQVTQSGMQSVWGGFSSPPGFIKNMEDAKDEEIKIAGSTRGGISKVVFEMTKLSLDIKDHQEGRSNFYSPIQLIFWVSVLFSGILLATMPVSKFRYSGLSLFFLIQILTLGLTAINGLPLERILYQSLENDGKMGVLIGYGKTFWFIAIFLFVIFGFATENVNTWCRRILQSERRMPLLITEAGFMGAVILGLVVQMYFRDLPLREKQDQYAKIVQDQEDTRKAEDLRLAELEKKREEELKIAREANRVAAEKAKREKDKEELEQKKRDRELEMVKEKLLLEKEKADKQMAEEMAEAKRIALKGKTEKEAARKKELEEKKFPYYPLPETIVRGKNAQEWYREAVKNPTRLSVLNDAMAALKELKAEGIPFLIQFLTKEQTTQGRAFVLKELDAELIHVNDLPKIVSCLNKSRDQIATRVAALRLLAKNGQAKPLYSQIYSLTSELSLNNNVKELVKDYWMTINK
ncbi:MAG: hypothetical protein EXR99_14825 [Gemmataceae bacterium]|nr:hypothetical protein [Gemmataceae bacterium]